MVGSIKLSPEAQEAIKKRREERLNMTIDDYIKSRKSKAVPMSYGMIPALLAVFFFGILVGQFS